MVVRVFPELAQTGLRVHALPFRQVEGVHRLVLAVQVHVAIAVLDIVAVRKLLDNRFLEGKVEVRVPSEVLVLDILRVDLDLDTAVAQLTEVLPVRFETGHYRGRNLEQQVCRRLVIILNRQVHAVEQAPVDTDVHVLGFLPAQHLITCLVPINRGVRAITAGEGVQRLMRVVIARQVTVRTIREAELQVGEQRVVLQEILAAQAPSRGYGPEVRPAVVRSQAGGTIPAETTGEVILIVVVVVRVRQI